MIDRPHSWAPWTDPVEREAWQRCANCELAFQDFRQATLSPAGSYRLWVDSKVYWAKAIPRCHKGVWTQHQLPAGEVDEHHELAEGQNVPKEPDQVFVCAGVCVTLDCDCRSYDQLPAADLADLLISQDLNRQSFVPVHDGCTCYLAASE